MMATMWRNILVFFFFRVEDILVVPAGGSDGTPAVATVDPSDEDNTNTHVTKMLPEEEEGGG